MDGLLFSLFGIFLGEAGKVAASCEEVNQYLKRSFSTMLFIVTAGGSIYPLGYFFGHLAGALHDAPVILYYNLANLVGKIAFCLAIWQAAKQTLQRHE